MLTCKLSSAYPLQEINIILFKFGHLAVDIFIVLSGYCLMLPVTKRNYELPGGIFNFFNRRFWRIYPTYFIAVLISVIAGYTLIRQKSGTLFDLSIPFTYKDIVMHLLLIHDLFYSSIFKINYVFWSIAVECRIYFLFPVIIFLCRKWGMKFTFVLAVLASFGLHVIVVKLAHWYPEIDLRDSGVYPYLILFALGVFAANFGIDAFMKDRSNRIFLISTICVMLIAALLWPGNTTSDLIVGAIAALLLIAMQNLQTNRIINALIRFLSLRYLVFLGEFSYSIYLIHPILVQALWYTWFSHLQVTNLTVYLLFIFVGTPVVLSLCYLFFLFFEKPFLNYKKKIKAGTSVLEAAAN